MIDSKEFQLLLVASHPQANSDTVSELLDCDIDWLLLLRMARWHRLLPQLYDAITPHRHMLKPAAINKLNRAALANRRRTLGHLSTLVRLDRALHRHNIRYLLIKGCALSQLLYSDACKRQANDIDILVAPGAIEAVEAILINELGFMRDVPFTGATERQVCFIDSVRKDRGFVHPDGTILELHWGFTAIEHPINLPFDQLWQASVPMPLHRQVQVQTLPMQILWLYQCQHGSESGWYRLRWLCDIAMLLSSHKLDWDTLLQLAEEYGTTRSLIEGVTLACTSYDLSLPTQIKAFGAKASTGKDVDEARYFLSRMTLPSPLESARRSFRHTPKAKAMHHLMRNILIQPDDFERIRLPNDLFFLYYFIRPVSLLVRRATPIRFQGKSA